MHRTLGVWDSGFIELLLGVEGQLGNTLDSCKGANSIKESPKHYRLLCISAYTHKGPVSVGRPYPSNTAGMTQTVVACVIHFGRRLHGQCAFDSQRDIPIKTL